MKSILLLLFALFCSTMAHFGMGRPPPDAVVCTVTANKLFINGYYIRELKGAEIDELHKYMEDRTIFEDKMRAIKKRRDDEDFHILKISHRFRRDAKFDPSPLAVFDDKPIDKDSDKSDLPVPPEKPSFCQKPKMPIMFGGQCMVIENKVYIRDQPVRDLTNEEAAQVDEYRKQQEEYIEKWRQVMGMRMQIYGPEAHPRFNQMQDGGGRGGMQQQPQQQGQMQQQGQEQQQGQMQQQGQHQQQPQMGGGPMFGGMHGGMGGFSMGNIKDADLELPEEPQIPYKICTFIA